MPNKLDNPFLDVAPEVEKALRDGRPVVALESTIICHGMPHPKNVETALRVEQIVRDNAATPATVAILKGRLKVGLSNQEINYLAVKGQQVIKSSRRDIPFIVATNDDGATTVAATMIIAAMAGIRIFATGGIGGVHRGVEQTMDVSADLEELAQTNIAVVCDGVKSVLDIGRTLEYLESKGVPVIGFGADNLPAFYTRDSGFKVDCRIDSPQEVAAVMRAKWDMHIDGGMLIANPVPEKYALDSKEMDAVIEDAIGEMNRQGIVGKDTTPFLLSRIAERTGGRSLETNIQLVFNNAKLAAEIAAAFTGLS